MKRGRAFTIASSLADCMRDQIEEWGLTPFCSGTVSPGAEVAWDFAGDCGSERNGQWWVRVVTVLPTIDFPSPIGAPWPSKATAWGVTLELGATRFIPGLSEDGTPPEDEVLAEYAQKQLDDMDAMRAAMVCCFGSEPIVIDPYVPLGPQGFVVGGFWTLAVSG